MLCYSFYSLICHQYAYRYFTTEMILKYITICAQVTPSTSHKWDRAGSLSSAKVAAVTAPPLLPKIIVLVCIFLLLGKRRELSKTAFGGQFFCSFVAQETYHIIICCVFSSHVPNTRLSLVTTLHVEQISTARSLWQFYCRFTFHVFNFFERL